jgi:hypothetical protein
MLTLLSAITEYERDLIVERHAAGTGKRAAIDRPWASKGSG